MSQAMHAQSSLLPVPPMVHSSKELLGGISADISTDLPMQETACYKSYLDSVDQPVGRHCLQACTGGQGHF